MEKTELATAGKQKSGRASIQDIGEGLPSLLEEPNANGHSQDSPTEEKYATLTPRQRYVLKCVMTFSNMPLICMMIHDAINTHLGVFYIVLTRGTYLTLGQIMIIES